MALVIKKENFRFNFCIALIIFIPPPRFDIPPACLVSFYLCNRFGFNDLFLTKNFTIKKYSLKKRQFLSILSSYFPPLAAPNEVAYDVNLGLRILFIQFVWLQGVGSIKEFCSLPWCYLMHFNLNSDLNLIFISQFFLRVGLEKMKVICLLILVFVCLFKRQGSIPNGSTSI